MEKSCSDEIKRALCDCVEIIILCTNIDEKLTLAQTIKTLSESLRILKSIKEKEGDKQWLNKI